MKVFQTSDIEEIVETLNDEKIIAVPTDTVYGLCGIIKSDKTEEKIRDIKHRPKEKSFPIMCANLAQIKELCKVDDITLRIIEEFMPGPLTIVLEKIDSSDTLAIRYATSKTLEEVILKTGPLYMTSANLSGEKPCATIKEIEETCVGIDGILEGTPEFNQASTVLNCVNGYNVLREGPISQEEINKVIKKEVE